jgi:formamidopyrimidine-DNA glycosylase
MPELPEVETTVRAYRPRLEGRRIARFVSRCSKQAEPNVAAVRRGIVGKRVVRLRRRAKYIVADLDAGCGHLLIHLRMSGHFEWAAEHDRRPRHIRAIFDLDDGNRLWFCDARKFGKIVYARDFAEATRHLGVEPLERGFTTARLRRILGEHARQIKPLLLDQSIIAGLGNIYADEALFRARLHPATRCDRLSNGQVKSLHDAIRGVLRTAIRYDGTTIDSVYPRGRMQRHLKVYGRAGLPCGRCGTPIAAMRLAQRGTHFCPKCQALSGNRRTSLSP